MSQFVLCRVCFAHNIRMYPLHQTCYQELYEKYTGAKLITGDGRLDKVCYICNTLLLRFHKFLQMSQKAEKHLTEMYHNGIEFTANNVSTLATKMQHLSVTNFQSQSFTDQPVTDSTPASIDPTPTTVQDVAVKIESVDYEDSYIIEDSYVIDDSYLEEYTDQTKRTEIEIEIPKQPEIISDVRVTLERIKMPKLRSSKRRVHLCQFCPRRFRSAALLRRHKCESSAPVYLPLSHGPRQFTCELCDRRFKHRSMFLVHHRTHTGEKPFECQMCDRTFNDKSNCRKHMKKHLNSKHVCLMCDRTFAERKWLVKHAVEHIL